MSIHFLQWAITMLMIRWTCYINWKEKQNKRKRQEPRLHKGPHCYCGKCETSTDKAQTEQQSTATTWKTRHSLLSTPYSFLLFLLLSTLPSNLWLSVHLSTWNAEIQGRLKGKQEISRKVQRMRTRRGRKKPVRGPDRGAVWFTQPALNSSRDRELESESH